MNPYSHAILLCVLLATSTGAWSRQPRSIEPADIAKDPSLVGKRVTLRACIGVPLSAPDGGEEFVLLYPCGARLDEGPPEGLIAGTFISDKVTQPSPTRRSPSKAKCRPTSPASWPIGGSTTSIRKSTSS